MTYEELQSEWESESDFISCHTSGSTGVPKHIELPKHQVRASALRTCSFFNIDKDSHLHSCISPDFIGGKMMMIRSILSGAEFTYEKPSNRPFSDYSGKAIDVVSVVPSQMLHILEHPDLIPEVRCYLIGGAPLPQQIKERISAAGISAYESYGMTETASHIALRKVDPDNKWFQTLDGISVSLSPSGCLTIEIDGWQIFHTNDVAEVLSPTTFRILGRADNVIITGGKKVFPEEVEHILNPLLSSPFFISSLPDLKWGQKIVLSTTDTTHSDAFLLDICRSALPGHMCPKEVIRINEIPLTSNGKIKRR